VKRPDFLKDATNWMKEILDGEQEKIERLVQRGAKHYRLVTNVPGTSHLDTGSIDKVNQVMAALLPIPGTCLWRDDLDRRLERHWTLKWAYPELMTGMDLIRALVEGRLSEAGERRARALRTFLADQHHKDREVRFKQADLRNDLLDMFIDVPAVVQHKRNERPGPLDSRVQSLARERPVEYDELSPRPPGYGAGSLLLDEWVQRNALKLVVEGAPGQGKSTMLQYVCQVHRMRLLASSDDLPRVPEEHRQGGVRVPFRIDLRDLAQWLGGTDPFSADASAPSATERSLEGFVAALVRSASGGAQFDVSDVHAIAEVSPLLLALDGLDEVVDVGDRDQIVEEITRAVNRLNSVAASLQVVVTSRPASFTTSGSFAAPFQYLSLTSITQHLIEIYRDRWFRVRELEDHERVEMSTTLTEKLAQPHFRDLCRNPMQLAIVLSLLHKKGPALPEQRTDLYRSYMEYFLDREAAKSRAVRDHRDLLLLLHGHIACLLHIDAEQSSRHAGRIRADKLVKTAEEFVESRGYPRDLFSDLFGGVFDRFGALVSRAQDTFEFEVQPLREYFAGYYLYETAPYSPTGREQRGTTPERLDVMLRSRFWLNVVRFYAGFYSVGELESLAGRLEALSNDRAFSATALPRTVTAQLLADWTLVQDPRAQARAVKVLLQGLGTRHAGSGEEQERLHFRDRPFVLPRKSGGGEFVKALLDAAAESTTRGLRLSAIARTLTANAPLSELADQWLARMPPDDKSAESHWWEVGSRLGVFRAIERQDLAKLLVRGAETLSRVAHVACAGVFWPVDESTEYAKYVIDDILSGRHLSDESERYHPLTGLAKIARLDEVALAEETGYFYLERAWIAPAGDWPDQYAPVERLVALYDDCRRHECGWTRELAPWVEVVDLGRTVFGEQDAFDRLALVSSAVQDGSERGGGHGELCDDSVSLVRRARYARYRRNVGGWWRDQLEGSAGRSRRIAVTLALAWASGAVITSLRSTLTESVEAMSMGEFGQLCSDMERMAIIQRARGRRLSTIKVNTDSPRLYTALETRRTERDRVELYEHARFEVVQDDAAVVRLMLWHELKRIGAASGSSDWSRTLALLRQAVKIGEHAVPYLQAGRAMHMPATVAKKIVGSAQEYPLTAVEAAEDRLGQLALRSEVKVGTIATRDGWLGSRD
jgi:hypothetical protein